MPNKYLRHCPRDKRPLSDNETLSGVNKYHYCKHCIEDIKKHNKNEEELDREIMGAKTMIKCETCNEFFVARDKITKECKEVNGIKCKHSFLEEKKVYGFEKDSSARKRKVIEVEEESSGVSSEFESQSTSNSQEFKKKKCFHLIFSYKAAGAIETKPGRENVAVETDGENYIYKFVVQRNTIVSRAGSRKSHFIFDFTDYVLFRFNGVGEFVLRFSSQIVDNGQLALYVELLNPNIKNGVNLPLTIIRNNNIYINLDVGEPVEFSLSQDKIEVGRMDGKDGPKSPIIIQASSAFIDIR